MPLRFQLECPAAVELGRGPLLTGFINIICEFRPSFTLTMHGSLRGDNHVSDKDDTPGFGDTLFGGSRFIFWCLGPLFLLVALGFIIAACFHVAERRYGAAGFAIGIAIVCVCVFLALLNGARHWWAGRVVTASVFGAYVCYLVFTWLIQKQPFVAGGRTGSATPLNAVSGLIIIGLPCLCFTFFGRFTPWKSTRVE